MAGIVTEETDMVRSLEGASSGQQQRCHSGEASAEWRSCEQVESGSPSTSPPYWDTEDDDDGGARPSQLYGKYTWKIDKFSQINKRELRSNAFEVGGYKWYILIYPQGCDVCNHLSLFLCVANHDKLLPGWSHFAQFTIAVVNKDQKKSKYSDTLHRFWKKEHDWGWKKFMELSKVSDGFIDADTLIIKAQVQVIRERANRPFRCLDCQYRRELIRVYLTNVEQICRRFVEERRSKLGKLIEDKGRWTSFCAFWLGMDQSARRRMSREKSDSILKVVVKHFFIEKEVTSTLVMDSLHSGLKALEGQIKSRKNKVKYVDEDDLPVPIVRMEKDMFVLVDDVLLLLERAAMEPLPPKDEKGPQNRMKDGSSGEDCNKESIERDERRLTELGRRTIEIFVLAQIFSKIEVAYQEAVALKRQEELIREEEAAWLAETEQKSKRGAADKEKKSKKKQGKQKRNNHRKGKDKGKDEKSNILAEHKADQENLTDERKDNVTEEPEVVLDKADAVEDISDVSDSVDCTPEVLQPDSEDREASLVNWDTDTSEAHPPTEASSSGISLALQNGAGERRNTSTMDDSSSTCSTDSVPSFVMNGSLKGNTPYHKSQKSPKRSNGRNKATFDAVDWSNETCVQSADHVAEQEQLNDTSRSCKVPETQSQVAVCSLQDQMKWVKTLDFKKEEEAAVPRRSSTREDIEIESSSARHSITLLSSPSSPSKNMPAAMELKSDSKISTLGEPFRKQSSESPKLTQESARLLHLSDAAVMSRSGASKGSSLNPSDKPPAQQVPVTTEKPSTLQVPVMSRPLSAPVVHGARSVAPVVSMVQTAPLLARSVSATGRLGPEASTTTHNYIPQSYRNVMMGSPVTGGSVGYTQAHSPSSGANSAHAYSQLSTALVSSKSNFSFGMVNHDAIPNGQHWMDGPQRDSASISRDHMSFNDIRNFDYNKSIPSRSQDQLLPEFLAGTSGRHTHGFADEFPHLDIINDLLDDDGKAAMGNSSFHSVNNGPQHLNRHFSFPGDIGTSNDLAPSTSSCRFERTLSYHDDLLQRNYGSLGSPYDTIRDMLPQPNVRPYANGQIDGMLPNQWQMAGNDSSRSFINVRNLDSDGYPYHHLPDYSNLNMNMNLNLNLACGVNGYSMFRPSNGH